MDVKGELLEAKIEVRETTNLILSEQNSIARQLYSLEDLHTWVNNGSSWKKQLQKEDQFQDYMLGEVKSSFLTLADFQEQMGLMKNLNVPDTSWLLMDYTDITSTDYGQYILSKALLPGYSGEYDGYILYTLLVPTQVRLPDMRGTSIRMKDHGRGLNPDGNLALGSYQSDMYASHNHTESRVTSTISPGGSGIIYNNNLSGGDSGLRFIFNPSSSTVGNIVMSGGNETRSKTTTANYFMKVNRTVL